MISTKRKFLFIHIPKTGGNAIRLALRDYVDDEIVVNEKQREYNERMQGMHRFGISNPYMDLRKHATLPEIHSQWDESRLGPWDEYFKFACVRNPWDRLVSLYLSPHKGTSRFDEGEFRDLIKNTKKGSQAVFVTEGGQLATDFLMRFEQLAQDFSAVCEKTGISAALSHVNQSQRKPYQEYYSNKTRDLVYKLYRQDIELFGYQFEA
jgi:hypothetical protein